MHTHDNGATGVRAHPIGLGLAALGRPAYIDLGHADDLPSDRSMAALQARTHEVLDEAWRLGVRYFDAARSYGLAERFLATWLADYPARADAVTVGSKWGYTYVANWKINADEHEVKDHSLATFIRQLSETRAELGTQLDLYQVHSASLSTGVLDDSEVMAALCELDRTGVVVGLSVSGPRQAATIEKALAETTAGRAPFGSGRQLGTFSNPLWAPPCRQQRRQAGE